MRHVDVMDQAPASKLIDAVFKCAYGQRQQLPYVHVIVYHGVTADRILCSLSWCLPVHIMPWYG